MILQYCMYMFVLSFYMYIYDLHVLCRSKILNNVTSLVTCVFSVFSSDVTSYIKV